ncbi:MAG TPA: hypothetical protein P5038_14085 [Candidatus Paceibacterota bacterium]|nr:hypothetical protein [Candidatus Paceibacterota bacterium]
MKSLTSLLLLPLLAIAALGNQPPSQTNAPPLVTLKDFKLVGDLTNGQAVFTLTATARVERSKGATLELLSGAVALAEVNAHPQWRLRAESNRFVLAFDRSGEFPLRVQFYAAVRQTDQWKSVEFGVAPAAVQPVVLRGLAADTQFEFAGAARPERKDADFVSFLPANGQVKLSWKEARPEVEGKLFFAAEMLSQISLGPGLMRQVALLDLKVMQGELPRVVLLLRGNGEVTRVQGDQVLAWRLEPGAAADERRLTAQFNQPQKEQCSLLIQLQTPLGAFPQAADAVQLRPEGATRFAGYCRVVNDGAVRLEVVQAAGLSQISPEQFPETDATRAVLRAAGSQRFAYRFSGGEFALRVQADQVQPELTVSEVLVYHLGENELVIDLEAELDIREAPLRELLLRVPRGYALARLNASGLADYFLGELPDQPDAELRLVYGQPVSGRQVLQLRLERNKPLGEVYWTLPRLEVAHAKSVRGQVAISADAGFRAAAERTAGLTEVATAFFPRKVAGIQAAFRLNEPVWEARMRIERLPQAVQADAFHLFSIGEGIAYGSSLINYVVSGAPVSVFKVELAEEYFNVEFAGKDIRNWQKAGTTYTVHLHSPVSGAYTLLATYERPFKAQGDTLAFTGTRPLDAQSEQGHTLVISAYQFQVKPAEVSPGLLALEPGEVPAEYRLFFDAPILAAYRYNTRPFNLKLELSPLAQGESLSQIVDRASLTTRISKEGQILTDARYCVKNRGHTHFPLVLPEDTRLWSASVNGVPVVPVKDSQANLIPLPPRSDPNAVLTVELKLAARSPQAGRVRVAAPIVRAPVLLAEWKLEPDTGQRLVYHQGSLMPAGGTADRSGFAALARAFTGSEASTATATAAALAALLAGALGFWRWAGGNGAGASGARRMAGLVLGLAAFVAALAALGMLGAVAARQQSPVAREVSLVAPVQQAETALSVEVLNLEDKTRLGDIAGLAWPVLLALAVWVYGWRSDSFTTRAAAVVLGWVLLAWAALRWSEGAVAFLVLLAAFLVLHIAIPALRRLGQRVPRTVPAPAPEPGGSAASAVAALLLGGLLAGGLLAGTASASEPGATNASPASGLSTLPELVSHHIRVEDKFVLATATIRWPAERGDVLPLLFEPAVLTRISYPQDKVELTHGWVDSRRAHQVTARKRGTFEIELAYQIQTSQREGQTGFRLPVSYGLVNRLELAVANRDVEVFSPEAVSLQSERVGSNTVARLVLAPAGEVWVGWKPRSRDVKREAAVFYAELVQLYVPAAGVVEGVHQVSIRPAQGELSELVLAVPGGVTIIDVTDASSLIAAASKSNGVQTVAPTTVSLWRFDPDTRRLRVSLKPGQSRPFALLVRSQLACGPLPLEQTVGLLRVEGAAGQIGLVGIATGNEVQLDGVSAPSWSAINLEDFPASTASVLQSRIAGLTVRRAFRHGDAAATASLKASAVEPDVRVETQDTLSLGEDRTVLAANLVVDITRAGIFRLSFVLPEGFEVEAISGPALSHWTELKTDAGRVITLHLTGKTEGRQQFAVSLAGPGVKATRGWRVPQLVLREAGKHRGTLLVVPEQGMRLQAATTEGLTQLDPQKSGIRQKGVLAFRVLQAPWTLSLDLEQVEPWVQVTSLQHATFSEALVKVAANLQYQIENTGLKLLGVYLPTNADNVRFQGEQLADFRPVPGAVTNELQLWEIKLHRRVIGPYLLQATYQTLLPEQSADASLQGVVAADVNLQRGFVTVQSAGRLAVRAGTLPEALQPAEWQSIPQALRKDLPAAAANLACRLVEPAFHLPLKLERHDAARLLPARVLAVTLTSVISDDGVMLTQARLDMVPGDKRLLYLTLPKEARFWFAFVSQNGVWPWREGERILIPLEQQSRRGQPVPVEFSYSCRVGTASRNELDLALLAPQFDLPLENITWRVSLGDKWRLKDWSGTLQLQQQHVAPLAGAVDFQAYLQNENNLQLARTKEAEAFMAAANAALEQGDPQQARRAFQAAYGLSAHDAAFNEDARVQLHNIKLQQALVGLNVRKAAVAGDTEPLGGKLRDLRARKEVAYSQQDAREIIDRNSAEENAALMRLAERIVQQQDAAVSSPAALRANVPEQGRVLVFSRAVVVDPWAELKLQLRAVQTQPASGAVRLLIVAAIGAVFSVLLLASRRFRHSRAPEAA